MWTKADRIYVKIGDVWVLTTGVEAAYQSEGEVALLMDSGTWVYATTDMTVDQVMAELVQDRKGEGR